MVVQSAAVGVTPAGIPEVRRPNWRLLSLAVLAVASILALLTFRDYGVTWDEDLHNAYGGFVLDYYLSWFRDGHALGFDVLYNYGAIFDTVAAALNRFSPLGIYETRHLLNAAVGVVGLVGCWKLGRALGGERAGFIALLFLLLTPNYYGQMFNNPKDIPFAVGFVWASYYMVAMLPALPRPPWPLVVKLGLAIGGAMGVRIGGLLLPGYLGLVLLLFGTWESIAARRPALLVGFGLTSLWRVFLPATAVAAMVMLAFWPYAQLDPLHNPLRALAFFSHQSFPYQTLFDGRFVPAWDLPWTYLPTYILLALPELILVLLFVAPVVAVAALARRRGWSRDRVLGRFLLGFTIVFPVAYAIAIKAVLFDGMRHFIFVLPPIAVAAALVADRALGWLGRFPYRYPVYGALAVYAVTHISTMVLLHPDQYVYYNGFVGGIEGARGRFKLDYWANSYAEAVRGLAERLRAQYGPDFDEHDFTVAVCGPPAPAVYYFPPNFHYTKFPAKADFFIAFTKDNCDHALAGRAIYRVERMDTLLSVVLDRREILAAQRVVKPAAHAAPHRPPASAYP